MGKPTFTNGGRELSLKILEVSSLLIVSGEGRGRFVPQMVGHGPIQNGAEAHSGQRQPPRDHSPDSVAINSSIPRLAS